MGLTSKERTARYRQRIYAEIDTLPKIECACGCRALIAPISRKLRPAQYAHGHNPGNESFRYKKGRISPMKGCKTGEPSPNRGKKLPIEEIERRTATRRVNLDGAYLSEKQVEQIHNRRQNNPQWYANVVRAIRLRDGSGPNNPMWQGGKSFLPYSLEFNDSLKREVWKRDKGHCQDCGVRVGKYGLKPNTHHLDFSKNNNVLENLLLLCVSCHRQRHHEEQKSRKLVGHKSDMLSLYEGSLDAKKEVM